MATAGRTTSAFRVAGALAPLGVLGALASLSIPALAGDEGLRSELAAQHVALARKLEKPGLFREIRQELLLALELDPDGTAAREKLGYKREGSEWKGSLAPARPSKAELAGPLLAELVALHVDAAAKLVAAAGRADNEGEKRALGGLALDESHDDKAARELLGFTRKGSGPWVSARETSVREAFAKAETEARASEPEKRAGESGLADFLELGALERREAATAVFLATPAASADLAAIGRSIDSVRRVWYKYLPREERPATGADAKPRPTTHAHWLVVAPAEHDAFVAKVVEPPRRALAKQLRSWTGWIALPGTEEKVFVYESALPASNRLEWAALTAVKTLLIQTAPRGVAPPGFLVDGLSRFFAGRATGKLEIAFVSTKTTRSVTEHGAQTFERFRASVRGALELSVEGDLERLATRSLNDLEEQDPAWDLAFVEYALAKKPEALLGLVKRLSTEEGTVQSIEAAFGEKIATLERDIREWARQEY